MLVLCLLQAIDITLGADNIHRLPGDFADQLRLLQPVLLFLLVEDRPNTAIGVIRIPAQRIHILLLVGRKAISEEVKIRNHTLHALWQKADLFPDSDQQALIAVLDSFVKKSMAEQVIGFNSRR
jgi:hypothetical protein